MKTACYLGVVLLPGALLVAGCQREAEKGRGTAKQEGKGEGPKAERRAGLTEEEAEIQAARAGLSAEDRKLVEAQEYCPVMEGNRLGSMGEPYKLLVKGEPVFLCCKSCRRRALGDPGATLAEVEKLKAKVKAGPPE